MAKKRDKDPFRHISAIPIGQLIYQPLKAIHESNELLVDHYLDSVRTLAYRKDSKGRRTKVRTLDMELERPIVRGNGTQGTQTIEVKPPLLSLVTINSLMVEEATIDFNIEVTTMDEKTTLNEAALSTSAGYGAYSMTGKLTTRTEKTRKTDMTAKYTVNVVAKQQEPAEGMGKLTELLSSAVEPVEIGMVELT